ncbi:MAG: lamin tail domain-containing protein [Melioribacteraceae bacterium]|nr:lamin tail domain-containing protein [Melioribacteraceae bacterium]
MVLAKDESIKDFYDFNAFLIVFNLPALNNGGDRAVLLDPNSFEIDSLTYTSSWGGTGGRSLERINFDVPSSDPNNWGTSVSPNKATPGSVNSLAPKDYDLFLSEININPSPPIENQELTAVVNVINTGLNSAPSYTVALYNDQNFNSAPDAGELVDSFTRTNLASGDSVSVTFELGSFPVGNVQLIGVVNFEDDEDLSNNERITEFSIFPPPPDYNDIVINEIMYAPQDNDPGEAVVKRSIDKVTAAEPEWIEIYNRSESTYLLSGWRIADAAGSALITTLPIRIEPNEFVVLADDSSFFNIYSSESQVIVMNLPALNNGGDEVKILNNNSFLVDSLEYTSAWGGSNGKSLERIDPSEPSTSQNNWGESISPNGATPGTENSIVPREFDLAVTYFDSETDFLFIEENSTFVVNVLNLGTSELLNASLQIFYDQNGDLTFTEDEIIEEFTNLDFEANELIERTLNYTFTAAGEVNLLAVINHPEDSFSQNDFLKLTKNVVEPNVNRGDLVINEFMYAPNAPYPEWIELYNNTDVPHQLRNFRIADASSSTELSSQNILIPAQSFLVIARDSIINQLYDIPSQVLIRPLPTLNNSGDKIMLFDNFERVIDSLEYTSDWGGGGGNSLEKINSFGNSRDSNNWTTSTDPSNGTPGKPNSILPKDYDVTLVEFYSDPAQPTSGDEISFYAEVLNSGINEAAFSVKLFESNSEGDKINQLDEVGVGNLAPGAEQTINFNYKIDSFEGDQFFMAEADFELDQDTSDNLQLILIAPATPPKALVINEIMFVPAEDEPEWIELYNRSDVTINLKDWIVSDVLSRPATAVISFENLYVEPDQFIVLAKDSNVFEYHPELLPPQSCTRAFCQS